ncbi:MAG: iron-sulfur cluster assembly scaffold protein [Pseudomonadota bacterium]
MAIDTLYGQKILEAAATIPSAERLPSPDASATKVSRVCGSSLTLDLALTGGVVSNYGLEAQACALGQAAASLTVQNIIGADPASLFVLRRQMRAMLKDQGGGPSDPRFADLGALAAIRDYPQRHASTLLIFDAIADCLLHLGYHDPAEDCRTE